MWFALRSTVALLTISAAAFGQDKIPWQPNLETAQRVAAETNRLVLVHFWAPWCRPCVRLEKEVFANPETAKGLEANFVMVKLNADEAPGTARLYGVSSLPTDVITTAAGRMVSQIQSPPTAAQYVAQMNRAAEGHRSLARKPDHPSLPQTVPPANSGSAVPPGSGASYAPGSTQPTAAQAAAAQAALAQHTAAGNDRYAEYFPQQQSQTQQVNPAYGQVMPANATASAAPPADAGANLVDPYAAPAAAPPQSADPYAAPPAGARQVVNPYATPARAQPAADPYAAPAAPSVDPYAATAPARPPAADPYATPAADPYAVTVPTQPPATAPPAANPYAAAATNPYAAPAANPYAAPAPANPYAGPPPAAPPAQPPYGAPPPATAQVPDQPAAAPQLPPGCPPVGLDGNCPVTLVERKRWVVGHPSYGAVHRGRTYLFLGPQEKEKFLADPDRYSPVLSGIDPVLALDSQVNVPGRREFGVFGADGHIYLFADEKSRDRFEANEQAYAKRALEATQYQAMRPGP